MASYKPTAGKAVVEATYKIATGAASYLDYGTAQLDLSINNKSSAAFAQVTIPMADQWNITLGARYTYDVKGMVYTTSSNSTGVPDSLVLPGCTAGTVNVDGAIGCSNFNPADPTTLYTDTQYAGQVGVIAGAYAAAPALAMAPGWNAGCQTASTNTDL